MKESKQCGCLIEWDVWVGFGILTLTYCPKHLAALVMYEALRKAKLLLDHPSSDAWHYIAVQGTQTTLGDVIDKALAQAEGKMP